MAIIITVPPPVGCRHEIDGNPGKCKSRNPKAEEAGGQESEDAFIDNHSDERSHQTDSRETKEIR